MGITTNKKDMLEFLLGREVIMDEITITRKELSQICKERNIKYHSKMSKQEMIEVLKWNDEDKSIDVHPKVEKRITDYQNNYRDDEEKRERARECSRRWRRNNPEKAREYFFKWQESLNNEYLKKF